jgi:hypothetical protein
VLRGECFIIIFEKMEGNGRELDSMSFRVASNRFHISLSPVIVEMLEKMVVSKGLSRSAVIAIAIEKYFREQKGEIGNGDK